MHRWIRKISDIIEFGKPYILEGSSDTGPSPPEAFVVKLHEATGGSLKVQNIDGHFVAFGNACTHMGCLLVKRDEDGTNLIKYEKAIDGTEQSVVCGPCPCHGTTFDLTKKGLVILGPATQNLPQLKLDIEGDSVIAKKWLSSVDPRVQSWPYSH